jgi:hypothetical protein
MRVLLFRRLMATSLAVGIVGAVMVSAPVGASAATQYVCTLSGTTTSLSPPIPAPPTRGGSGSFAFDGNAKCVSGSTVATYGVSSTGTYTSVVCGTGTASGTATFTGGPSPIDYTITFAGGQGVLKVVGGGSGKGAVSIRPSNTGGCVNAPVTGFVVTGAASIKQ